MEKLIWILLLAASSINQQFLVVANALPDLSCGCVVAGRESCFTMQDAPGATIKWNGFSEIQDSTNPAKHI